MQFRHTAACLVWAAFALMAPAAAIDLKDAVVVAPASLSKPERKALQTLVEEVEKRSQVRLRVQNAWPSGSTPAIAVGQSGALRPLAGARLDRLAAAPPGAEGFRVQATGDGVIVAGNDERGVLFGVGWLLRHLRMERGQILEAPDDLSAATAPKLPLRGHQLGFRPKVNSYDGFTVAMWEQYIRDLAIFGTNSIELIPPRSDDADDSPHFPLPKMEMMVEMSRIADDYGLDVWIWYPALDRDYSNPATVDSPCGSGSRCTAASPASTLFSCPAAIPVILSRFICSTCWKSRPHCFANTTPRLRCGCRRKASTPPGWRSSTL
jgi:hypothetical protein